MERNTSRGVRRVDEVDCAFEHDESILGKWECVDFVEKAENFKPVKFSFMSEPYIKQVEFIQLGEMRIGKMANDLRPTSLTWTKGYVISKVDETKSAYFIQDYGGVKFLFLEWKSGDYSYGMKEPWYYVFKRLEASK